MNRLKTALIASLISMPALAQFTNPFANTQDRLVMQFNWNTWLNNTDTSLKLQTQSRGFDIHWMFDFLFKDSSKFSIAPGLGISTANVFHKSFITATDSATFFTAHKDSLDFKKNKLATTYVEVPLELRFRSKSNKSGGSVKIAVGAKAGLLLAAKTKYVGPGAPFGLQEEDTKVKTFKIPNVARFRYGLTFRAGYSNVNLVAFYALSTLFDASRGPVLNPFSVGISFNLL